ncbi:Baseplate protein J-like [uncultured Caudovirales phage]|uniref:Baseplate protein J-like n=1 Tax=uncultured Caudovirales phage TaxID=2100421 RepID=A0A6J5Q6P1_9CAUD|nr:Baseplate protein J-like [uncultured Caudovirales phage]CAB4179753.1 Baseplate protein J-like [uncultured Caudovirales phage]CAB4188869.1 Baseplate protein J-like [uncultured Caudovirales phage]
MANTYIPQVDYTSRDYEGIRADLIDLIPQFAPEWTNRDPSDIGVAILELFAYMGDILNFYIDRSANEAFITTASQRENVLQLAQLLNYIPTDRTASTVTLTFQNSTASPITVPVGTQVGTTTITSSTSNQVIFETDSAITVAAKVGLVNGSSTVTATQGTTVTDEVVGISDNSADQAYALSKTSVINGSVSVTIEGVDYAGVQYLIDYSNSDPVFSTFTASDGVTYIVFGDNVSGRIPPNSAQIYATYRVGGGASGNVPTNTIKYILTNAVSGLTVSNQDILTSGDGASTGGSDIESTDSIRVNAPKSIRSINRAVSLKDYADLTAQVSGIAKATALAAVYTSVTVYFAPFGDKGVELDGVTPSAVFNSLSTSAGTYLEDKMPANTTVTFQPPSYVPVDTNITITVLPQYRQTLVTAAVLTILESLLAFDNVNFADRISLQDVMTVISSVPGVAYCQVTLLSRQDARKTFSINNKALTTNVATLTTSVPHSYTVGETVLVSDVDGTFNGTFVITATGASTISYSLVTTNVGSTAVSPVGTVTALIVNDIVCTTSEIPEAGDITLLATGGITN